MSWCRFGCSLANGSAELTDGVFIWPEGLAHYVAEHSVALPDDFRQHAAKNHYEVPTLSRGYVPSLSRAHVFELWAIGRSPEPAPRANTLSLVQAQNRAAMLSTNETRFSVEPFNGRWQIIGRYLGGFIPPLRTDELDELLAGNRVPDTGITPDDATRLAAELSGPHVEIRYTLPNSNSDLVELQQGREEQFWLVCESTPFGYSEHLERAQDALGVEIRVTAARRRCERALAEPLTLSSAARDLGKQFTITEVVRDGAIEWRIEHARRTVEVPSPNRLAWAQMRWDVYHEARRVPMLVDEAQMRLREFDPDVQVAEAEGQWVIVGAHAEGVVQPLGEDDFYRVVRDLKRAGTAEYAAMALEVLRRR